ncbi:MAG: lysylphosphatidylglycerol synthase transmembrane domain-containing protein [Planctomycetota bacterium]|jgi:uncharacterized protein (TIRG00374 family)
MTRKRLLRIVVSLVLLAVLALWVDLGQVRATWAAADPGLIVVALVVATVNRVLMAVKWNLLLRARDVVIGHGEATRVYYTSSFIGIFLPPTVGGDVVRAYLVGRRHGALADIVASIFVERLLGLVVLLGFGAVACLLCGQVFPDMGPAARSIFWIAAGGLVLAVAGFAVTLTGRFGAVVGAVLRRLEGWRPARKITGKLGRLYDSYRQYGDAKGAMAVFTALTVLENTLPILRTWIVAAALGVDLPLAAFFVVVPIELLIIRLPISFDGFGLREGAFVFFLSRLGVDEGAAFGVGLANHLLFLVALLPGGLFAMLDRGGTARARADAADAASRRGPGAGPSPPLADPAPVVDKVDPTAPGSPP